MLLDNQIWENILNIAFAHYTGRKNYLELLCVNKFFNDLIKTRQKEFKKHIDSHSIQQDIFDASRESNTGMLDFFRSRGIYYPGSELSGIIVRGDEDAVESFLQNLGDKDINQVIDTGLMVSTRIQNTNLIGLFCRKGARNVGRCLRVAQSKKKFKSYKTLLHYYRSGFLRQRTYNYTPTNFAQKILNELNPNLSQEETTNVLNLFNQRLSGANSEPFRKILTEILEDLGY